jgi:Uma2 family endonuclease
LRDPNGLVGHFADIIRGMEKVIPKSPRYSLQEYFRLADESPTKLEFDAGQIIDMAGATYDHNRIAANLVGELRDRLKGKPCEATGSDTRVLAADGRYAYPDVTVVCDGPEFDPRDPKQLTITNPHTLFEVLSPSTEARDRGEKFIRYINIKSMQAYYLVAQHKPQITSFVRREDGSWSVGDVVEGLEGCLRIQALNIELPMSEIYANVKFEAEPAANPQVL